MAHTGLFTAPVAGSPPVGMSPTDGRLVLGGVFGTAGRLVSGGAFTPSASAMTATVAQAVWQLPDVTNSAATFLSPTDLTTLTFAAAPSTGGRVDLVCVKQNNVENGDADSRVSPFVVTGTPSGTPVAPSVPSGATAYIQVLINAGVTNLAAATVTNFMQTKYRAPDLSAPTLAALNTAPGTVGQHATVTSDTTTSNNGDWVWSGSTWLSKDQTRVLSTAPAAVIYGSIPPAGTRVFEYDGVLTINGSTNSNGDTNILYPFTVPNGVIAAHLDRFDYTTLGFSSHIFAPTASQSKTQLNLRVVNASGGIAGASGFEYAASILYW